MNLKKIEDKLKKQKEELREMLQRFAEEDVKPEGDWDARFPNFDNDHLEEAADEVEEFENLKSIEHSLELKLKKTNEALERLDNDEYGKCENCGAEIKKERLKVVPEARACQDCN